MAKKKEPIEYPLKNALDYGNSTPTDIAKQELGTSILKTFLGLLPPFGPIIYEGTVDYHRRVKQRRINHFLELFKEYLEKVNVAEIDTQFLKSEDFAQLFDKIIMKVSETKNEEKLRIFRDILVTNIAAKKVSDFSETFLMLIGQLHEKQIEILRLFRPIDNFHYEELEELKKQSHQLQNIKLLYESEVKNKNLGLANNVTRYEDEISALNDIIEPLRKNVHTIAMHRALIKPTFFKLSNDVFFFFVQDLSSKSLLFDRSAYYKANTSPFSEMSITEFGKQLLEFIETSSLRG